MGIYLIVAFSCSLLAVVESISNLRRKYGMLHLYGFIAVWLLLFFMAGFRECGFDYFNYKVFFNELNNEHWLSRGMEIGSEPEYSLPNYT